MSDLTVKGILDWKSTFSQLCQNDAEEEALRRVPAS